jgi:dipeptidyl-peptidase-4
MKKFSWLLVAFLSFTTNIIAQSQQKHLTLNDAVLGYYKGLYPKNLRALQWVDSSENYIYSDNNTYIIKDTNNQLVRQITLSDFTNTYPDLKRIPHIQKITKSELVFQTEKSFNIFDYQNKTNKHTIVFDEAAQNHDFNFNNQAVAYTIDNNLFVSNESNAKLSVTDFKDKNIVSGQAIHRYEFGISKGTFWSPKGNYLAFYQKDETHVTNYPLVDITTYPATLTNTKYPMAGQKSEQAKVGVYSMTTNKVIYLNIDTTDEHYLTNLSWTPDEKYLLLAEINREQNHMWYNIYDAKTGKKYKTLFEEISDKWVEPETPALFLSNSTTKFLWLSERDGFMNIYQYNLDDKSVDKITNFDFVVTKTLGFDTEGKYLYVEATGNDPKGLQVYKINLTTKKVKQITKNGGTHRTQLSDSGNYLIDNYSSIDTPRKIGIIDTTLKSKDCQILLEAENPLQEYSIGTTEFIKLKANDGTALEARLIKPANFDKDKKYPVLVYVYGGPHAQLVTDTWLGGASLWMHYLSSEKDYLVFTIDNRGSAHRGFAFESSIHRNQGGVAMEDQIIGVNYLKSLPYVDANRLAIHGWSYGGFMTISMLLRHPDVFTTGVAGGPVTDWKYYEVMYGERYMDMPQENPDGYENTRVHKYIKDLQGNLLIIHGSIDDTVVPQHSMTLLKEAVEKEVQIDFFTYPMHPHNVRGKDRVHLMDKVLKYILTNNK